MTNDKLMVNDGARADVLEQNSSFELRHSFILRHWGFVIS
jgi:hypothetical protein